MRYFELAEEQSGLPREVPRGRILAHNHIQHTIDMPDGVNGFRFWTWPAGGQPEDFVPCPCGWSGFPHYAARQHIGGSGGRCISAAEFERDNGYTIDEVIADVIADEEEAEKKEAL